MIELIQKKRDGKALSEEEIRFMIQKYVKKEIPDYQMSAFLMAVYFKGMNREETLHLTRVMAESGRQMDLSGIPGIKVDKHSTGGIGDKTTLIVTPAVAALGIPVPKMSGRGLGYTGGTIDKLESIPGFVTQLSPEVFLENVKKIGLALAGQSADLAVADKMIYALRDVTATVDSMPLIASSIMSKKIASGADAIVLDVKTGSGAFMKEQEKAEELAQEMIEIGRLTGRKTSAILSDMEQPLGNAVGNLLEVIEAAETLLGNGPKDLTELSVLLGAKMLCAGGGATEVEEGKKKIRDVLEDGRAFQKFEEFIRLQGGKMAAPEELEQLLLSACQREVASEEEGYISRLDALLVGKASLALGAGRETKESGIDPLAGIRLTKKIGSFVEKGEALAVIYAKDEQRLKKGEEILRQAYSFSGYRQKKRELIKNIW